MRRPILALLALVAAPGCEDLFEIPDGGTRPVDMFVDNAALAGRWTITGRGDLRCSADPAMDIDDFRLETASFDVVQDEDGTLTVPDPPRSNDGAFAFEDGKVDGLRVGFATREETVGTTIRLEFTGRANEIGNIAGTFTGDGPRTCTSSGDFAVDITRN